MRELGERTAVALLVLGLVTAEAKAASDGTNLVVDQATLFRTSATKGKDGRFTPPWRQAVFPIIVPMRVPIGTRFTVIPRAAGLKPCQLRATKVSRQPSIEEGAERWEVDLDATTDRFLRLKGPEHRHGEMPIDAVVIYPAIPGARLIEMPGARDFVPSALGLLPATLWAAVDTNRDGKPEILIFRSCCEKPEIPEAETGESPCDHTCVSTYFLAKTGWRKISESGDF